jgi:hypothetical protein
LDFKKDVTGVQTCALPIFEAVFGASAADVLASLEA